MTSTRISSRPDDAYSLLDDLSLLATLGLADHDLLRSDLCRVYRFETATPGNCALFLHNARVKSAFYEQCGVQEVGCASRKWPVSDVLAVFVPLMSTGSGKGWVWCRVVGGGSNSDTLCFDCLHSSVNYPARFQPFYRQFTRCRRQHNTPLSPLSFRFLSSIPLS